MSMRSTSFTIAAVFGLALAPLTGCEAADSDDSAAGADSPTGSNSVTGADSAENSVEFCQLTNQLYEA
jgi:hypothetical protein